MALRVRFYTARAVDSPQLREAISAAAGGVTVYETRGAWFDENTQTLHDEPGIVIEVILLNDQTGAQYWNVDGLVSNAARRLGEKELLVVADDVSARLEEL